MQKINIIFIILLLFDHIHVCLFVIDFILAGFLNFAKHTYTHFSRRFIFSFCCPYTELQSQQGMDFLEGFGKKKNQHHLNNLSSIHINPLTAQPSLNIHLHG